MKQDAMPSLVADAILVTHAAFIAFVVIGLLGVIAGGFLRWRWVRNPWFRWLHLAAIALVVVQSWMGVLCPLTVWEMRLRELAGETTYGGSFIAHWLHRLIFFEAPLWVFTITYSAFGAAVVAAWVFVRPSHFRTRTSGNRSAAESQSPACHE